ncbi:MAG TPA: thiamine phosphate synthase [Candidatus Desulfovibrio intestinipullorum]|uniref:Thiamine-phosphate synthase n=1 Tax=Candidatus Desulfovibrio intestinipullorum TaxID=2838536 RepID=A0A9D1PWI4_9BACT|nr:thiamine phosphate synthase [Candidatus Desulfovibrio intestinipullorum]
MPVILPGQTDLYALTDEGLSRGRSLEEVARALLGAGIRILQYREKRKKDGEKLEQCRLLRRITREYNACFIIDDHVDIAMLCEADGVHVGQEDIPLTDVRALVGSSMCIGVSTHAPEQALAAVQGGADYIGVGPVYATQTKEDVCAPVGLNYVDWVSSHISLPFVCIGGIKAHNIHEVVAHGGTCCALVSEFVSADDIAQAVEKVRRAMHG